MTAVMTALPAMFGVAQAAELKEVDWIHGNLKKNQRKFTKFEDVLKFDIVKGGRSHSERDVVVVKDVEVSLDFNGIGPSLTTRRSKAKSGVAQRHCGVVIVETSQDQARRKIGEGTIRVSTVESQKLILPIKSVVVETSVSIQSLKTKEGCIREIANTASTKSDFSAGDCVSTCRSGLVQDQSVKVDLRSVH